ncbi:hypothetical protein PQX77_002563 [Marasmius sp. AFHP31]|nr:hypothetical protein PQX77_002563 [Marasmius sp. AFHP31]
MPGSAPLTEQELVALSRQELQKIARVHQVKANAKSTIIIKQLLAKFPQGVPRCFPFAMTDVLVSHGHSSNHAKSSNRTRSLQPKVESRHSSPDLPPVTSTGAAESSSPLTSLPHSPSSTTSSSSRYPRCATANSEHLGCSTPNVAPLSYCATIGTSTRATSPQPPGSPSAVKHAIGVIRELSEEDKALSSQVDSLRTLANKLNRQATQLSDVLRRERESRERILTFATYYTTNNNRWGERFQNSRILSEEQAAVVKEEYLCNGGRGWKDQGRWEFEEIWGGPIRVARNLLPVGSRFADWFEITEDDEHDYLRMHEREQEEQAARDTQIREQQLRNELIRKRHAEREGNEDEERRYNPRRRLEAVERIPTENLVGLNAPGGKGKRRMTAAEVQAHEQEQSFQMLDEDDSREIHERETRERTNRRIAARLAADIDSDVEDYFEEEEEVELDENGNIVKSNVDDGPTKSGSQVDVVVFGAVLKMTSDILAGHPSDDDRRDAFVEGLHRLSILGKQDANKSDIQELAELANSKLRELGREDDRLKHLLTY